jgi:hypothetical protein
MAIGGHSPNALESTNKQASTRHFKQLYLSRACPMLISDRFRSCHLSLSSTFHLDSYQQSLAVDQCEAVVGRLNALEDSPVRW